MFMCINGDVTSKTPLTLPHLETIQYDNTTVTLCKTSNIKTQNSDFFLHRDNLQTAIHIFQKQTYALKNLSNYNELKLLLTIIFGVWHLTKLKNVQATNARNGHVNSTC